MYLRDDYNKIFGRPNESRTFANTHSKQIKLVQSFDWLDMNLLDGIIAEIDDILKQNSFIDADFKDYILKKININLENSHDILSQN